VRQDVWTVDADGTNRQRLTDGTGTNLMPYWGADGRVYFISDRDGHECVWSARADTAPKTFTAETDEREAH
jgi:Tol biopolymer transport system component